MLPAFVIYYNDFYKILTNPELKIFKKISSLIYVLSNDELQKIDAYTVCNNFNCYLLQDNPWWLFLHNL